MKPLSKISSILILSIIFCLSNVQAQTKTEAKDLLSDSAAVYSKVETEASFPGGNEAWSRYLSKVLMDNINKFKKSDYGTCIVRFIVNTKGQLSDVQATTMKKSRLAKVAVEAIENGPRWNPAQQNGKFVNAYRLQPITISLPDK